MTIPNYDESGMITTHLAVCATEMHFSVCRFTAKERDTESGNDYFGARYYASTMGRWMSPDPAGLSAVNPSNPQSWNLYSYALNNPLINTDPTGLDCVYMNDNNDGVESIDHNSDSNECGANGGTWRDGWVGSGQVSVDGNGNVNVSAPGKGCVQAALRGMIASTEGMNSKPNGGYGSFANGTIANVPAGLFDNASPSDLIGANTRNLAIADPQDLSGHPNVLVQVRAPKGGKPGLFSDAFGRYQIMSYTAAQYGFTDFSPAGQDAAANYLMDRVRHMVSPAMAGDLAKAIARGANEWASLPGNNYGQGGVSADAAQAAYNQAMQSAPECQ